MRMKLISPHGERIGDLPVHDFSYIHCDVPVHAAAFNWE
jgi:hypothetical protein